MTVEQKNIMDEYEVQVKLHINEQLYRKGLISKEWHDKAQKDIKRSSSAYGSIQHKKGIKQWKVNL